MPAKTREPKLIKETLLILKSHIDLNTVTVDNFSNYIPLIEQSTRQIPNTEILELMSWIKWIFQSGTEHSTSNSEEHTSFSGDDGMVSKIDHALRQKASIN